MHVYILGAGASHGYVDSPTLVRPPLAKDFFKAYSELDIAGDRYVRVGNIVNYVRDTRGISPWQFSSWNENIEDFLTELDDRLRHLASRQDDATGPPEEFMRLNMAYDQMLFLFESVLNEIQNGPTCRAYSQLCSQLEPGDVVITFNWDCLLDRALWDSGRWHPDDGYLVTFARIFENGWRPPCTTSPSEVTLLKLHGSTNWLIPYHTIRYDNGQRGFVNRRVHAERAPVFCFVQSDGVYDTYEDRSRSGYAPFSYFYYPPNVPRNVIETEPAPDDGLVQVSIIAAADVPGFGKCKTDAVGDLSIPLMIGPVRQKVYDRPVKVLESLWSAARSALTTCDTLTIIGYSCPENDVRSWQMLDQAVVNRRTRLNIELIDPYPQQLASRIKAAFDERVRLDVNSTPFEEYISRTAR